MKKKKITIPKHTEAQPPTFYDRMLAVHIPVYGREAVLLCHAYCNEGMTWDGTTRNERILDRYDLVPEDCTPIVVHHAQKIYSILDKEFYARVEAYNARFGTPEEFHQQDPAFSGISRASQSNQKIFGYFATAVIRWMGVEKWNSTEAMRALKRLGCVVQLSTVQAQLLAGKKGERGEPAKLTEEQANSLYNAAE
jgi:hypothetical protein